MHHRNVYIKKYDKLAHLINHKMARSIQRRASVISNKTFNNIPLPIIGVWEKIIMHAKTAKFFYIPELQGGGARAPVAGDANATYRKIEVTDGPRCVIIIIIITFYTSSY